MNPELEFLEYDTTLVKCETTASNLFNTTLKEFPTAHDSINCNILTCGRTTEAPVPIMIFSFTLNDRNLADLQNCIDSRIKLEKTNCGFINNKGEACQGVKTKTTVMSAFHIFVELLNWEELDNADLYVPTDPNKIPKFLNKPGTYQVATKDTIVLPCEVYNPDNFVLAWKKGIAILTAGTTKVTPEERIRIVEGYNLEIRNAQINDAGNYICQIGTLDPVELKHTLQILIPPRIVGITSDGKVSAKKGSDVTLQCNSTGNPPPTITWSRKNNMLPNGEKTFVGNSYTIDSVRRQADGVYICAASNNIGTANEEIDLNILYPPEVKEEQSIVFTVEGQETDIVCIVHAEPKADVLWYRDTLQLDMTEWRITDVRGNRYTLRLRKVQKTDFGNYSCVADNGLGKSKRFIEVTGRPDVAIITSPKQGRSKNSYEMLWTVKSYSPILEYKLLYRPDKTNKSNQEIQYKRPMTRWNDWTELLITPASTDQLEKRRTETIRDLDPGTKYEATVQSRNRYGWSEVSQPFFFTTSTKNEAHPGNSVLSDPELRDMSITAINEAPMTIQASLLCVMVMVIYYFA